jgi:hypothetical protein
MPRKVSKQRDHICTTNICIFECPLLSGVACVCVVLWANVCNSLCLQQLCKKCNKLYAVKEGERHRLCSTCYKEYRHPSSTSVTETHLQVTSSRPPLFPPLSLSHSHLTIEQRWTIIVKHKEGVSDQSIADQIPCDVRSVRHWINHYELNYNVDDIRRSGRKRKTTHEIDEHIEKEARETKFTTPRRIKRKLQLDVSSRTIDRRLIEVGLFGRVARHKKKFSEEEIRKRLSFAEGYKNWTEDQWMQVMFADEKIFWGEGFSGQVWVRRPKGEALNPDYCVDKDPHPEKVNVWGCFCGKGVGYSYIFNENMDGKKLQEILGTHLVESAELHYDVEHAEQWWFLQDNDPKHKSTIVRTWLFNHGIQLMDFPPYSPDLNPIEHLWADLARRVEKRPARTMEELQDIVAEEWAATSVEFLTKLAKSMPARCQAVIDAKGNHTKY